MIKKLLFNRKSISLLTNQYLKNTNYYCFNNNNFNRKNQLYKTQFCENRFFTTNNINNNNKNSENNDNINKAKSNSLDSEYHINSKDLTEANLINNIKEINQVAVLSKDGIPKHFEEYKDLLYKCDPNELDFTQRLLASSFLWQYLGKCNLTPKTLNKDDLEKIWNFLDMDTSNFDKERKEHIELQQLIICFHSRSLIPKISNLMKDISKRETISERMALQCFLLAPHLSLWDDMIKYAQKVNDKSLALLNVYPYSPKDDFSYPAILEILKKQIETGRESKKVNSTDPFIDYTEYSVHSFGFKNPNLISSAIEDENKFQQFKEEYIKEMDFLKTKISDKDGYILSSLGETKYLTMLGGAVKLYMDITNAPQLVCSGIFNKERDEIYLYGNIFFENENNDLAEVQSEYNLQITRPNDNDDVLTLLGTHTQTQRIINTKEALIYTMDVKINLIKDK
ncbi:hypothetical protein DICPUDRAFT_157150 [Dictyostelium purpureum]|uniref:Uncharacterized protein n=1 Tax=Dictyostelium purpureum TaxID=5786 RepID=F0ZYE0_DICPU|nr:uncharacterized protein DICPUDRAFT_157150 [Dictyostelium purpureum]EGC31047.1 hypothetical protein DICPUDRAFT_157150 [Dictyostelium purpureum]|eukprot:XP_003292435.1 hypothetical protein DICPUDRAFT_157150 [Dictyostelium purpureum]